MRTPASIAGHPIHPMLVPIPIGLWLFSLVCDLIYQFVSQDPLWSSMAVYTMGGGILGALAAAIPGFIDFRSLPVRPRRTAIAHMSLNLTVVVLYVINISLRAGGNENPTPFWLSVIAIALLVVSGWLGGKMVYLLRVAVEEPGERAREEMPRSQTPLQTH
jgi:uncharacterized membrane protein